MAFTSTNTVFKTLRGQIEQELGHNLDGVVIFGGTLQEAVEQKFAQPTREHKDAMVFFGFSDETSPGLSGGGGPLRQEMVIDFYLVTRTSSRRKYEEDVERLIDLSDEMMFNVFDCANWSSDMQSNIYAVKFVSRRRASAAGSSLMAHMLRFIVTPAR